MQNLVALDNSYLVAFSFFLGGGGSETAEVAEF